MKLSIAKSVTPRGLSRDHSRSLLRSLLIYVKQSGVNAVGSHAERGLNLS